MQPQGFKCCTYTTLRVELDEETWATIATDAEPGFPQSIEEGLLGVADRLVDLNGIREGGGDGHGDAGNISLL